MDEAEDTPKAAGDKPFDFDAAVASQRETEAAFAKLRELRVEMEKTQAEAERRLQSLEARSLELAEFARLLRITELQPKTAWGRELHVWFRGGGGEESERRLMSVSVAHLRRLAEWHSARGDAEVAGSLSFISNVLRDRLNGRGWLTLAGKKKGRGANQLAVMGMITAWKYIEAQRRRSENPKAAEAAAIATVCRVYAPEGGEPLHPRTVKRWMDGTHFDPSCISTGDSILMNENDLEWGAKLYRRKPSDTLP